MNAPPSHQKMLGFFFGGMKGASDIELAGYSEADSLRSRSNNSRVP
jgi:hypothetical protein